MAYMGQDRKKGLLPGIKAALAKYGMKGSVAVRHHSTLVVNVVSGPLDLVGNANACAAARNPDGDQRVVWKSYVDVNPYHARDQFSGDCRDFVLALLDACNVGNHDRSDIMSDYFDVGWYVDVNIGRWDKPYQLLQAAPVAA